MPHQISLSRRSFLQLSAVTISSSFLVACQAVAPQAAVLDTESTGATSLAGEVVIMMEDEGDFGTVFANEIAPKFNETFPDIQVTFTPDQGKDKVLAAMAAGDAPDIVPGCCGDHHEYAQRGQLLDMQPLADASWSAEDLADFHQGQLNHFRSAENGWFAMPYFLGVLGLYYNVEMFEEMGVALPPTSWADAWTYDEYQALMQEFAAQDASGAYTAWGSHASRLSMDRLVVHLRNFGGSFTDPNDNTRCLLSEPAAQEALWWLYERTWGDHGYANDADIESNARGYAFPNRKIAMMEEGTWSLDNVVAAEVPFVWNVAPLPKGMAQTTLATNDAFGIWKNTPNSAATWEVMNMMMSPDFQRVTAKVQQLVPPRKSLLPEWYSLARAQFPQLDSVNIESFGEAIEMELPLPMDVFAQQGVAAELLQPALERIFVLNSDTPDIFKNGLSAEIEAAMHA